MPSSFTCLILKSTKRQNTPCSIEHGAFVAHLVAVFYGVFGAIRTPANPHNYWIFVLRQTLLFSKGQFLLFSLFFSFFPNISHLTLHFPSLFLQFSLRQPHHRVNFYETCGVQFGNLEVPFFSLFFSHFRIKRGLTGKNRITKIKIERNGFTLMLA